MKKLNEFFFLNDLYLNLKKSEFLNFKFPKYEN